MIQSTIIESGSAIILEVKRNQERYFRELNDKIEPVEIIVRKARERDGVLLCDAKDEESIMP